MPHIWATRSGGVLVDDLHVACKAVGAVVNKHCIVFIGSQNQVSHAVEQSNVTAGLNGQM